MHCLNDLTCREVSKWVILQCEHIGKFQCNDEFYNQLWNKALDTMNLNMRDAIQDPDRERSQWWGDAAIILHEIFKPQLGNLKWVNCTVPIFDKELNLSVKSDANQWELTVENNTGKECILALPKSRMNGCIRVNGQKVICSEQVVAPNAMVRSSSIKDEHFIYLTTIENKIKITL